MNSGRRLFSISEPSENNLDAFNVSNAELNRRCQDGIDHFAELSDATQTFNSLTAREIVPPPGLGWPQHIVMPQNLPLTSEQVINAFHQQQIAMAYVQNEPDRTHARQLKERAGTASLMMQPQTAASTWNGEIETRRSDNSTYSCKIFVGGIPYDVSEQLLYDAFSPYGRCKIEWPGREVRIRIRGNSQRNKTVGYIYVIYDQESSVKELLSHCVQLTDTQDLYFTLKLITPSGANSRHVQVIPWDVADANYVHDTTSNLDPKKTVFVGGLHGVITAGDLFKMMNHTFGDVAYVGIDTDRHKYPIGSGRVTFSSYIAFFKAVGSAHLVVRTSKFVKRIQLDPFLEEAQCMVCDKMAGPYFCRERNCFCYFCQPCWQGRHFLGSRLEGHKALSRVVPKPYGAMASLSLESSPAWLAHTLSMNRSAGYGGIAPQSRMQNKNFPLEFHGIEMHPHLYNLQTQTPPPTNISKQLFNFPPTMSMPSTPLDNMNVDTSFIFPPGRFA